MDRDLSLNFKNARVPTFSLCSVSSLQLTRTDLRPFTHRTGRLQSLLLVEKRHQRSRPHGMVSHLPKGRYWRVLKQLLLQGGQKRDRGERSWMTLWRCRPAHKQEQASPARSWAPRSFLIWFEKCVGSLYSTGGRCCERRVSSWRLRAGAFSPSWPRLSLGRNCWPSSFEIYYHNNVIGFTVNLPWRFFRRSVFIATGCCKCSLAHW